MKLRENRLAAQKQGSNHQSTNYRWIEIEHREGS
jgi:hypothetical protein